MKKVSFGLIFQNETKFLGEKVPVHNQNKRDSGKSILADGSIGYKQAFNTDQTQSDCGKQLGHEQAPGISGSQRADPYRERFQEADFNEQNILNMDDKKIILTIPLIKYNEEKNYYQILRSQDWPKLPKGKRISLRISNELDPTCTLPVFY